MFDGSFIKPPEHRNLVLIYAYSAENEWIINVACTAHKQAHSSTVKVITTTGDRSKEFKTDTLALFSADKTTNANITLKPTEKFQIVYGFGAAITGSTCYNLMQMSPADRKNFLIQTFSETEGFGQNYVRVSIGCSDFSLSEYTLCDTKGIVHVSLGG